MQEQGQTRLEPGSGSSLMIEVGLADGTTLSDAGADGSRPRLEDVERQLSTSSFVAVGERLVVRSEQVRYVRLRDDEGETPGLLDTIKDKIGGGQMSTYGTEPRQTGAMRSDYDEPTQVQHGRQGNGRDWREDYIGYGRRPWSETKPFFLTSEFLVFFMAVLGVGIAMAVSDILDAQRGWTLMTAIAIGYMVSRGIAKAGARDPNPERRYRD
jgi:hypothetical protein